MIKSIKFKASDYEVRSIKHSIGKSFIIEHHYAKGCSNTQVYGHGLFKKGEEELLGVAMWLPPTRVACESVNREDWKKVLSLTRLAIHPTVPTNGASFLIAASIKLIKKDGRFKTLVTYADEGQNHKGMIYKATNWVYVGRTGPYVKWVNGEGKQTSAKATKNRTVAEMISLGMKRVGSYHKHKFVMHL